MRAGDGGLATFLGFGAGEDPNSENDPLPFFAASADLEVDFRATGAGTAAFLALEGGVEPKKLNCCFGAGFLTDRAGAGLAFLAIGFWGDIPPNTENTPLPFDAALGAVGLTGDLGIFLATTFFAGVAADLARDLGEEGDDPKKLNF